MIAKIIISANEDETRMGLLENGILMEYLVERREEQHLVGSIFKGKVCNVVRGIQAALLISAWSKMHFCIWAIKECYRRTKPDSADI